MNRIDAMAKVKKLMAMTTERGCTEDEAKTAAGLAAKIMMEHAIEAAALEIEHGEKVEQGPCEIWDDPLDTTGGRTEKWRQRLACAIAHQMGCEILSYRDGALKNVGRPDAVQGVRYVYAYCAREVARLTVARAYGNGRLWVRSYRLGLIDAIRAAMKREQEAAASEAREHARQSANANALVLVQQAITLASVATAYGETKGFLQSKGFRYRSTSTPRVRRL